MKIKFVIGLLLSNSYLLFSQNIDTIYSDKEWTKCSKELAFYYCIKNIDNSFSGTENCFYITGEKHSIKNLENGSEHGNAKWWYKTGQKWCEGNYNKGIEDGKFIYWYSNGNIKAEGIYVKGERDNNWKYYDEEGNLTYDYNEVNKKPLFLNAKNEKKSTKLFLKFLIEHTSYPEAGKEMNLEGRVLVEFTVNEFGKVINVNILKGINHYLDEAAKKTLENIPDWTPGVHDGKNVRVKIVVPINYKLN